MKLFSSLTHAAIPGLLTGGSVGVIPTDTVYGLVARAGDEAAVERLYALKTRARQPGTIVAANIEQLRGLGFRYHDLHIADQYWPNALSVILEAAQVPGYLKTDLPDLAVRIPNHQQLLEVLGVTGPLMTTSANHPRQPTATNIATAIDYFDGKIDFYVDAGELGERLPSTIIRIRGGRVEIVRPGAVALDESHLLV